jgi:prepilin-type N-terminal cleavage/methylation domain-containing protein
MESTTRLKDRGFTLLEVLIVVIVIGMSAGFLMVNFPQFIARARILTSAQQVGSVFQRARLEAVRRNQQGEVEMAGDRVVATIGALTFEARLEGGVTFGAPAGEPIVSGFGPNGKAIFRIDGLVEEAGAFRLAGHRDYFVEVRIDPPATARVEVRKWDPVSGTFKAQGEGGESWKW